jgi:peroxiredoxin Q/BCP
MTLAVNDPAPDFDLPADGGGRVSLADFKGKTLALYFYPKDDTPGCTTEAKGFSESADAFAKTGAAVVGVSKDSVKRHDKFKAKYDLDLRLGADETGATIEAYGVWVEKTLYGRNYMGIERATFLIDGEGRIRHIWHKVKTAGHAAEVLSAVQSIA